METLKSIYDRTLATQSEVLTDPQEVACYMEAVSLFFGVVWYLCSIEKDKLDIATIGKTYTADELGIGQSVSYKLKSIKIMEAEERYYIYIVPTTNTEEGFLLDFDYISDFQYLSDFVIKKATMGNIGTLNGAGVGALEIQAPTTEEVLTIIKNRHNVSLMDTVF